MAVASRRSENIELQDEENDTSITARMNVERSGEGHYERLDLQKRDDAQYEDLRTKTKKDKDLQKIQSGKPVIVVAVCLGMMSLMLLGVIIAQNMINNSMQTPERNMTDYNNLILEITQLKNEAIHLKCQIAELSCPSGWKKFGCSCYYRNTADKSWQQSRDECLNQGADLVIINNREEQVFLNGLSPAGGSVSWIGLNRTEGRWTWVDGTPLATQYWASGWPADRDRNRNCTFYSHATDSGKWMNGWCSDPWASICEK